jgi:O-antigen/teichoic acid export membrane protein
MFTWYVVIRVDQFFVPLFFDTRTLGLYASAVKIVETSNVLIVIMQAVVTPRILSLQQADTDTRRVNITTLAYVICGICAMIGTVICAPWIVSLLFGTRFSDATPILQVYALSIPGLFVTYLFTTIALSKGSYKPIAILSTGVAIVVLLMTYVAAYMGSIQMVAAVSVITYTSVGYILYILWRRNIV